MNKEYDYKMSLKDYFENQYEYGKFAAVITKQQLAVETNIHTHDAGRIDLIRKTRPDIETDAWGNAFDKNEKYTNSYAIVFGYPGYVLLHLPESEALSPDQFRVLKEELLEPIKKFNAEIDAKGHGRKVKLDVNSTGILKISFEEFGDRIDELISILEPYVKEPETIKEEVIIGTPFKGKEKKEEPILEGPVIPDDIDIEKEADKLIEDMAAGIRDTDGNLMKTREERIRNLKEMIREDTEERGRIRGFSTISIITIITSLITIGILVLGIILTF